MWGCMMDPIFPEAAFFVRVGLAAKVAPRLIVGEWPKSSAAWFIVWSAIVVFFYYMFSSPWKGSSSA